MRTVRLMSDEHMFKLSVTRAELYTIMKCFYRDNAVLSHDQASTERGYENIVVGISPDPTYRYPSLTLIVDDPDEYTDEAIAEASEKSDKRAGIHGAIDDHFMGKLNRLVDEQPLKGFDTEKLRRQKYKSLEEELNDQEDRDGQPPIQWPVDDPNEQPPDDGSWDGPDGWDEGRS